MSGRALALLLVLLLLGMSDAVPVATSAIESEAGQPLAACGSAGLKVCRFYVSTDQPLLSVSALLSIRPTTSAATIYHDPAAGTNFPPTNPPVAQCNSYVAGGAVGVNETAVRFNQFGPTSVDASWFFLSSLAGNNQLVLQIALNNSGTAAVSGTLFMSTIAQLPYSSYVSCGIINTPTCPSPCRQLDLVADCTIDANDLFVLLAAYGAPCNTPTCYGQCATDFDNNGQTDANDLFVLLASYGSTCPNCP